MNKKDQGNSEKILLNKFVVNNRPFCLVELENDKWNQTYIKSIKPNYFSHLADLYYDKLDKDKEEGTKEPNTYCDGIKINVFTCFGNLLFLIGCIFTSATMYTWMANEI